MVSVEQERQMELILKFLKPANKYSSFACGLNYVTCEYWTLHLCWISDY